nr:Chain P, Mixed peptide [Plasmodium berghei ANKA]
PPPPNPNDPAPPNAND